MAFAELANGPAGPLPIKVIRSQRRKKSSAARVVDGVIEVRIPSWMNTSQETEAVETLAARIEKKRTITETAIDLMVRARTLATIYKLPAPSEIKWVTNQTVLWGSCSFEDGVIRISSRLISVPDWVLDYVILHEITHLIESDHGPAFHLLMERYPKYERAEGFLEAMALGYHW
jgi:predicted metal-dependent hydrolase